MLSVKNSFLPCSLLALTLARAAWAIPALPPLPAAPPPVPVAPASPADTTAAPAETVLYGGQAADQSGLTLAAWGGGAADENADISLANGHSLRVTTLDFYQGAQLTFSKPVSLEGLETRKNLVLQITLKMGTPTLRYNPANPSGSSTPGQPGRHGRHRGGSSAPSGMPPGMMPPGMMPPGMMPAPSQGADQTETAVPTPTVQIPPIQNLRLLFTLSDGRQADILRPIPDTTDNLVGDGWKTVNVSLGSLQFPTSSQPQLRTPLLALQSITVGGDHYGIFNIGRMRVVDDETPISALLDAPQTAVAGDNLTLRATADAGLSQLRYSWDFDSSDGITEQATGPDVTTSYPVGGKDYTVTLTVTDVDGIKKPVQTTAVIHVK